MLIPAGDAPTMETKSPTRKGLPAFSPKVIVVVDPVVMPEITCLAILSLKTSGSPSKIAKSLVVAVGFVPIATATAAPTGAILMLPVFSVIEVLCEMLHQHLLLVQLSALI